MVRNDPKDPVLTAIRKFVVKTVELVILYGSLVVFILAFGRFFFGW